MSERRVLKYIGLGWQMAGGAVLFTVGGYWLDRKYAVRIWTLIGVLLGMGYCGYVIWRLIKDMDSE